VAVHRVLCIDLGDEMKRSLLALLCLLLASPAGAQGPPTAFSNDVETAIDRGLQWFDDQGYFFEGICPPQNADPTAMYGRSHDPGGLVALALLEKRRDASQNAVSAGYVHATVENQARIDSLVGLLIDRVALSAAEDFRAYQDGGDLMALSVYYMTGGPNPGALMAVNKIFDRVANNQGDHGYWGYSSGDETDSSTTQLVMAGLAAARRVFTPSPGYAGDPGRLATLDELAARARQTYIDNSSSDLAAAPEERGHPYNPEGGAADRINSLQQTSSGLWIQLVGGADLNDESIQGYMRWLQLRYQYTRMHHDAGKNSIYYYYYFWSFAKSMGFIEEAPVAPADGNLSPSSMGQLPADVAPADMTRETNLEPAEMPRPALFGNEGPGYYADPHEQPRWYFDLAYTLLTQQDAAGRFVSIGNVPVHSVCADQAFAILVLERSLGGGCIDTDGDSVCDDEDNCVLTPNADQLDANDNGVGDACEDDQICCLICDFSILTTPEQCALGQGTVVPDDVCCPEVCCQMPDGSVGMIKAEDCLPAGGIALELAICEGEELPPPDPEVCCVDPASGEGELMPAGLCDEMGAQALDAQECIQICCMEEDEGQVTLPGQCAGEIMPIEVCDEQQDPEVCCILDDGQGDRQLMPNGNCQEMGGEGADPHECNQICCVSEEVGELTFPGQCQGQILPMEACDQLPAPCLDRDGDTICDEFDNCPDVPNVDQADTSAPPGVGDACEFVCCVGPGNTSLLLQEECLAQGGNALFAQLCEPVCCVDDEQISASTVPSIACQGQQLPEPECDPVCCAVGPDDRVETSRFQCDRTGMEVAMEECVAEVCCQFRDGRVRSLAPDVCQAQLGIELPPEECAEVCCELPGGTQLVGSAQCVAQQGAFLEFEACAPQICCARGDERSLTSIEECLQLDGQQVPIDSCQEDVCCELEDQSVVIIPVNQCQEQGIEVNSEGCGEVCCLYADGRMPQTTTLGTCTNTNGMVTNAARCVVNDIICCGFVDPAGGEVDPPALRGRLECADLGGQEFDMAICRDAGDAAEPGAPQDPEDPEDAEDPEAPDNDERCTADADCPEGEVCRENVCRAVPQPGPAPEREPEPEPEPDGRDDRASGEWERNSPAQLVEDKSAEEPSASFGCAQSPTEEAPPWTLLALVPLVIGCRRRRR